MDQSGAEDAQSEGTQTSLAEFLRNPEDKLCLWSSHNRQIYLTISFARPFRLWLRQLLFREVTREMAGMIGWIPPELECF